MKERNSGMERTVEDCVDEMITNRIDQILREERRTEEAFTKAQEDILQQLDRETRRLFEGFVSELMTQEFDDYKIIYRAAFLDGLRLGHKAF